MIPLGFVLGESGGTLSAPAGAAVPDAVAGVGIDSRTLGEGDLFVALPGERSDGHLHVRDAAGRGAAAAMVERPVGDGGGLPLVSVGDCARALGALGGAWRRRFSLPVAGVTGSNGKTTLKEMVLSVMRVRHGAEGVLATRGNLNNHLGVPLTLLRLRPSHACAVVEMGMSAPGEIAALCAMAAPTVAVVNNAQRSHVGPVGGLDSVARCKGEIVEGLVDDGVAVLNMDDPHHGMWLGMAGGRKTLGFSMSDRAAFASWADAGLVRLGDAPPFPVRLRVAGAHNRMNALAAACVAHVLGASPGEIAEGLGAFAGMPGRMQERKGINGLVVLDDTYNANPDSALRAIEALAERPEPRRLLALGDMLELGDDAPGWHAEVGRAARGLDGVFTVGALSAAAADAAGGTHFGSKRELLGHVAGQAAPGTVVLVKGSRGSAMEEVVRGLLPSAGEGG